MRLPRRIIITVLCFALPVCGQGNSFDKVRYNGGSVDSKVDPKDWHNHLTVTSDTITVNFKDGKNLEIYAKSVTSISYGHRTPNWITSVLHLPGRKRPHRSRLGDARKDGQGSGNADVPTVLRWRRTA
jgi:hypothetical protein